MYKLGLVVLVLLCCPIILSSQYLIDGTVDGDLKGKLVHLDILDSWNGFNSVSDEKTIKSVQIDSSGKFRIEGNELDEEIGFYRIRYTEPWEYVMIQWLPRNYIFFTFSNNDTIRITNTSFVPNNYSNDDLLPQILKNDSFTLKTRYPETERHEHLLIAKQKEYFKNKIEQSSDPLNNLYSLSGGSFDIVEDISLFKSVSQQLDNPNVMPAYKQSLDKEIHIHDYPSLSKRSELWFRILLISILANVLLIYKLFKSRNRETPKNLDIKTLTNKEEEILSHIANGKTNKEIANELFVSDATIKTHINNIYRKLNIKSRKQATEMYRTIKST